ncbi:glutathione S-transferase family protein [Archangium violaceum]|jgi:glutathione S-transferase|uniref:glutathione S-transferase family protein n=1 Tax=Archangium violaceum TaxID=83451 RepID=UPI0019512649|nr:glutathione S-transferase family protein [Archangium violaceum]QRN93809.1 glutathione S-transferase family protein [Archangium violaceum]
MITLYQTPTAWGTPNLSPFCIKLESYLRMTGQNYQVQPADLRKAPKGKVPYVDVDGRLMGDSQFIIEYLKQKFGDTLDSKLTDEQKAIGHTVRRMLEESTYWNIVYTRWVDEAGWRAYVPVLETMLPVVLGNVMLPVLRRKMFKTLHAQGMGRHNFDEVQKLGKDDITAVSTIMGSRPFLLGETPTSFDASVYAFLVGIIAFPVDSDFKQHTLSQGNLVEYCARFKSRFFANWKPSGSRAA